MKCKSRLKAFNFFCPNVQVHLMVSSLFFFFFIHSEPKRVPFLPSFYTQTNLGIAALHGENEYSSSSSSSRVGEQIRTVENMIFMTLFYFYKPCFLILFSAPRCSLSHTLFLFLFLCSSPLSFHYFIFPPQKGLISCFTHSFRSLRLIEALLSGNFVPDI